MSELKACPFCGGEAKQVSQTFLGVEHKWIQCVPCGGSSNVEAWNRRPTPPPSGDGDVQRLRELFAALLEAAQSSNYNDCVEDSNAFERLVERLAAAEDAARSMSADVTKFGKKLASLEQEREELITAFVTGVPGWRVEQWMGDGWSWPTRESVDEMIQKFAALASDGEGPTSD